MSVNSPSFITKVLLPQRRPDVLRRSRLVDFLHQNIDHRLLLVCAPAGYGKTTLLVDFAHDVDIPVCWYSLGAADTDIRVFLEYLIAAIRQRFPDFGKQTEAVLRASDVTKELSATIGVLVNEMHAAIPQYFILVLDDFHAVDGNDHIKNALDLMLYYLPENCHIIVSSRTMPRLTLSRLAAHRQVAGLGNSDLRFTAEEIRQFLSDNHKVFLTGKTADTLARESEGWIAGIVLTTHSMWQGLFENIIRTKGAGGEVFDYLASEVFAHQAEDVQRFLLATSVLEQVNTQTCSELLDGEDAQGKLLYLQEASLFTERLEGDGDWFRYHQLFRSFLENRLRQLHPRWSVELHQRAADIAARRGAWDEVIGHLCQAGDHNEAANLVIERADEMITTGKQMTLGRWIDALPSDTLATRPHLLLVRGRICLKSGETDRGLDLLNQACRRFEGTGEELGLARTLAVRSVGLAVKLRYAEAIADCHQALAIGSGHDNRLAADVRRNMGICYGMQGQFHESIAALDEALRLHRGENDAHGVAALHQSLGVTYARMGDVPRARFHFEQALGTWRRTGNVQSCGETLNSIGALLYEDGEPEAALATLGEALEKARSCCYLRLEAAVLADIGDVHRTTGRYSEAIEQYERALEIARRIEEGFVAGRALNGLGDTYARIGEDRRADRFIRQAIVQAEERQSRYEVGSYETSLAMLRCDQGDTAKALRSATTASEMLRECGAKRELTRALLARARAMFLGGRRREALAQLERALAQGAEIDYDLFLTNDGQRCQALLEYAQQQGIEHQWLAPALAKLSNTTGVTTQPPSVPALQPVAKPRPAPLRALALGQACVVRDGCEITRSGWASDKVRELFFFLVGHTYALSREQIVESVWPDLPPGNYGSTFHSTMYRLRRALQGDYVIQHHKRYRLNPDVEYYYDVAEFERLLEEAGRAPSNSAEAIEAYQKALSTYQGPYLKEFTAEWCQARRQQLTDKYLCSLAKLASIFAAHRQYDESIDLCRQVLDVDNYREDVHLLLLDDYVGLGDLPGALRHYRRLASFLRDELGIAPSARLRAAYEQIVGGARVPTTSTS